MRLPRPNPTAVGFTLVELLVIMAIIAVLAVLSLAAGTRMAEYGRSAGCVQNLRLTGEALRRYLGDHDNTLPTMMAGRRALDEDVPVLDTVLAPYLGDPAILRCPSDRQHLAETTGTSYHWNNLVNGQNLNAPNFLGIDDLTHIPLIADKEAFHIYQKPQVNILYADGRASSEMTFFTEL